MKDNDGSSVSAIVLTMGDRNELLRDTLGRLAREPVDEVLVVDNGSPDGLADALRGADERVRVVEPGGNVGIAGRNMAAREARGRYLLMLDDDSYPVEGAVDRLRGALEADPRLAVACGLIRDVDAGGNVRLVDELGTFDWFLRAGRSGPVPADGLPVDFFAEGGSLIRRDAYLEAGGFFEPYFFACSEVDLTTRLIKGGWDVRYFPEAVFNHVRPEGHATSSRLALRHRIRNNAWYLWLHFPLGRAIPRIAGYLAFDLIESLYRRAPGAWAQGAWEAWRDRDRVRHARDPVPASLVPRIEIHRGRLHVQILTAQLRRKLGRLLSRLLGRGGEGGAGPAGARP